jgi:hypothetical protein
MQSQVSFKIVSIDFCHIVFEDSATKQIVNLYHKTVTCHFSLSLSPILFLFGIGVLFVVNTLEQIPNGSFWMLIDCLGNT